MNDAPRSTPPEPREVLADWYSDATAHPASSDPDPDDGSGVAYLASALDLAPTAVHEVLDYQPKHGDARRQPDVRVDDPPTVTILNLPVPKFIKGALGLHPAPTGKHRRIEPGKHEAVAAPKADAAADDDITQVMPAVSHATPEHTFTKIKRAAISTALLALLATLGTMGIDLWTNGGQDGIGLQPYGGYKHDLITPGQQQLPLHNGTIGTGIIKGSLPTPRDYITYTKGTFTTSAPIVPVGGAVVQALPLAPLVGSTVTATVQSTQGSTPVIVPVVSQSSAGSSTPASTTPATTTPVAVTTTPTSAPTSGTTSATSGTPTPTPTLSCPSVASPTVGQTVICTYVAVP